MRLLRIFLLPLIATLSSAALLFAESGDRLEPESIAQGTEGQQGKEAQKKEAQKEGEEQRTGKGRQELGDPPPSSGKQKSEKQESPPKPGTGESETGRQAVDLKSVKIPRGAGADQKSKGTGATREAPTDTLPEAFARFDRNGDGRLGPGERRAAQEALNPKGSGDERDAARGQGFGLKDPAEDSNPVGTTGEVGASASSGTARRSSTGMDASSRIQAARNAVAAERARRKEEVYQSQAQARERAAARGPEETPLAIYRSLSKYQPREIDKASGKGWAPIRRQGVKHGKKRGSAYYREQISRASRGRGRRGGGYGYNRSGGRGY